MGANSTQALAITMFLLAFTFLAGALAADGNLLLLLAFLVALIVSVSLFLKAKPWEHMEK